MAEKMRKVCCETAMNNFSGDSRVSEVFDDRTTVMAPIMARTTPKRSRYLGCCQINVRGRRWGLLTVRSRSWSSKGAKRQFAIRANWRSVRSCSQWDGELAYRAQRRDDRSGGKSVGNEISRLADIHQ